MSTVPVPPSLEHTLENVNSGTVKIKTMKLVELKDLCGYYHEVIHELRKKLKEEKASGLINEDLLKNGNNETSVEINAEKELNELRAEHRELKDLVLIDANSFNAKGNKPAGLLSRMDWDTCDRSVFH
jgi:hypothetical protein